MKKLLLIPLGILLIIGTYFILNNSSSKKIVANNNAKVSNPIIDYNNLYSLSQSIDYKLNIPKIENLGYEIKEIRKIANLAEITYIKNDDYLTYRTSKGNTDNSGDYNIYENIVELPINNTTVILKGNNGLFKVATWSKENLSYSLAFSKAASEEDIVSIINSIEEFK